ncbi:acyl carrier protein [Streptomyces sp. NPDC048506]|uniref:acyl carrier protein n=1 Tax=Streptomyces sp. NPDC048506 TaxID=3155028 RepID=UPI00342DC11D
MACLPPEETRVALQAAITQLLAGVMQMDPDALDPHHRLDEYGLDSLMATELLMALRHQFNIDIPRWNSCAAAAPSTASPPCSTCTSAWTTTRPQPPSPPPRPPTCPASAPHRRNSPTSRTAPTTSLRVTAICHHGHPHEHR